MRALVLLIFLSGCDLLWFTPTWPPTDGSIAVGTTNVVTLMNNGLFEWAPRAALQAQQFDNEGAGCTPGNFTEGDGRIIWDPTTHHFLATELAEPAVAGLQNYCMIVRDDAMNVLANVPVFVTATNTPDHADLGNDSSYIYIADAANPQVTRLYAPDAFASGTISHQITFQPPPSHGGQFHPAVAQIDGGGPHGDLVTFDDVNGIFWVVELFDNGPDNAPTAVEHEVPLPYYPHPGPIKAGCVQAGTNLLVECLTHEIAQGGVIEKDGFLTVVYTSTYIASSGYNTAYVGIVRIDPLTWQAVNWILLPQPGTDMFFPSIATDGQTVYGVANTIMPSGYVGAVAFTWNLYATGADAFQEKTIAEATVARTTPIWFANVVRFGDYSGTARVPDGGAASIITVPSAAGLVQPYLHTSP